MNKIFIVRNAYYYDFGGGERLPVDLSSELQKYDYSPTVVSRAPKLLEYAKSKDIKTIKGWWWPRQDWSGCKTLLVPIYFIWQFILLFWYLRIIITTSADVLHLQSKDDFIAGTLAARLLRKKILWSDYADLKYIYQNNRIWYKNPIGKVVFRLSRFANTVILTSDSDKKLIEQSLGEKAPKNHKVIRMGVSSEPVTVIKRPKEGEDWVIFGATSRLVTTKGIGELITAFNNLSKNNNDIKLWLFGEGPDEKIFRSMAQDNPNIKFWGFPSDSLSRLADCDIFIHPSYLEGFSISLLEAAKLGLPIIACDVGGNPELVKDGSNGLLVNPKSAEDLEKAMRKLIDNLELRKKLGRESRKTYEENFVFEDIIRERFIPLYE